MEIKIKSKYKKSPGFVYNKAYYVLAAIFRSEKFVLHEKQLHRKLNEVGFIPPSNRRHTALEIYKLDNLIDDVGQKGIDIVAIAEAILEDFGLKNESFKSSWNDYCYYLQGILDKIFFSQTPKYKPYGYPSYKYDKEQNPTELWIQIHPWTTKEVYDSYFPFITVLKEKLLNSIHKIKPWETFERDLELYKLYLQIKEKISNGVLNKKAITGANPRVSKSPFEQMVYCPEYEEIKRKYPRPKFDDSNLARIITDTKNKLDNIQLL